MHRLHTEHLSSHVRNLLTCVKYVSETGVRVIAVTDSPWLESTHGHAQIQKTVPLSLQVSSEEIQLEDVNNGWHQRPIRPHTPFTISIGSCESHSDLWEQCWNKYCTSPEVMYQSSHWRFTQHYVVEYIHDNGHADPWLTSWRRNISS